MSSLETRALAFRPEIRALDDSESIGTLTGYASVFGQRADIMGIFSEEIAPGAFAESLTAGDDVRALYDHDTAAILGRRSAQTLRLSEDQTGLAVEIDLADTTLGRDILANVRAGNLDGMSIGFRVRRETWDDDLDLRIIESVELLEVSVVTFPAYTDTTVSASRGLDPELEMAELRSLRDSATSTARRPDFPRRRSPLSLLRKRRRRLTLTLNR